MKKIPTCIEGYANDPKFYGELTVLKAQEVITEAMEKQKVSYKELSKRIGLTEQDLKGILSEGRTRKNQSFDIRTLGLICHALGFEVGIITKPIIF